MENRTFGKTGLKVTPLGFGASEIGSRDVPPKECERLLNGLLDAGIGLIDTAACYQDSEVKIGQAVSHRRGEFVLTSKCGHQADGLDAAKWSPQIIRQSIERSLKRLQTDHIDCVFLHSCSEEHLDNQEMIAALQQCKQDGLTRFIGYSGDAAPAKKAVDMGTFDCLETSVNICDQQVLELYLPAARAANMGVIAKRPLGNACWLYREDPKSSTNYARPYADRLRAMGFTPQELGFEGSWAELMLRFAAYQPGVHCAITGSTNLDHVRENAKIAEQGPLDESVVKKIRQIWTEHARSDWIGQP